jgi:predicted amidohydrolase YtcJ
MSPPSVPPTTPSTSQKSSSEPRDQQRFGPGQTLDQWAANGRPADVILLNARIATMDRSRPLARQLAIRDGLVLAVGADEKEMRGLGGPTTRVIDAGGRTIIPGLHDSHMHLIRGGLNFNLELRWDGVKSLAEAMTMLKAQAQRTPPPQWVRVIGGYSEFQFAEGRLPTLDEINKATGDVPCLINIHYAAVMVNKAALRALGIDRNTPNPPHGLIQRDIRGEPTGLMIAEPSPYVVYSTIGRAPVLSRDDQLNSTRQFMRELNRVGITSVCDAAGGNQSYPQDYSVINQLHAAGQMTVRIAYSLFAQHPGEELQDYTRWTASAMPGEGDAQLRLLGAGENIVWSGADFENFLLPRDTLAPVLESELEAVIRLLAGKKWPFRIHCTYDETITRFLDVFERVNADIPLAPLGIVLDHAETVSDHSLERAARLGAGFAIQHRMAYQGEFFIRRYGRPAAEARPPIKKMLAMGLPVGGGSDATRISTYNPFVSLYWMTTGKTVGGTEITLAESRLDRMEALRVMTDGSAWISKEQGLKGRLERGMFADCVILDGDYFSVPDEAIPSLQSLLTIVGGRVVYGAGPFGGLAPPALPVSPDWSPHARFAPEQRATGLLSHSRSLARHSHAAVMTPAGDLWGFSCPCFMG